MSLETASIGAENTFSNAVGMRRGFNLSLSRVVLTALLFLTAAPAFAQAPQVVVSHSVVNVAITSTQVVAANTSRGFLLIENDSDTSLYCKIGVAAVVNEGIRINSNGGSFEMSRTNRNLDTRAVNCIHGGAGTKTMLVTEG